MCISPGSERLLSNRTLFAYPLHPAWSSRRRLYYTPTVLPAGVHVVHVRTTDMFGHVYTDNRTVLVK
jgi:hypothetical protein